MKCAVRLNRRIPTTANSVLLYIRSAYCLLRGVLWFGPASIFFNTDATEKILQCTHQEKKITETKYDELRRDCIERQQQLAGLNSNLRKDLSQLEARLDQLPEPTPPDNSVGPLSPSCGLPNGAATNSDNMREELMALRKKVDIVAANVLGEAEGIGKDRPNTSNSM